MTDIWKPNVTVAAIVFQNGRYLLVEEHTSDGLRLNQPAGHLDPGESLEHAVVRETMEECARPFHVLGLQGVYLYGAKSPRQGVPTTYLRFAFVGTVGERIADRQLDEGIVRTVWMTPEEVHASAGRHRSAMVLQCVADHCAGKSTIDPCALLFTDPSALGTPK